MFGLFLRIAIILFVMRFEIGVTGATGRLGVSVVKKLKNYNLRLFVRNCKKAEKLFPRLKAIELDLERDSLKEIQKAVKGCKVVIHLAGLVDLCASREKLFSANCKATAKLIAACEKEKVSFFIYCSSIAVYSNNLNEKITEDSLAIPSTVYGESKLCGELAVTNSKLNCIVLRPGMIYGPSFKEGFVDLIEKARKGQVAIIGSGVNCIPLVFEEDVSTAFLKCVELLKKGNRRIIGEKFNVVGKEVTQLQCFQELANVFNLPFPKKRVSKSFAILFAHVHSFYCKLRRKKPFPPEYVQMLARNREYDYSKAANFLGFAPISLKKGMKKTSAAWK